MVTMSRIVSPVQFFNLFLFTGFIVFAGSSSSGGGGGGGGGDGVAGARHANDAGAVVVVMTGMEAASTACERPTEETFHDDVKGNEGRDADVLRTLVRRFADIFNSDFAARFNTSLSITVIEETCDGTDKIIPRLLDLQASTKLTGVITMTSSKTADEIAAVLSYLHLPLVEIVGEEILTKRPSGPQHYVIPHTRHWQIQSLLETAHELNWTALSLTTSETDSLMTLATAGLFKRLAIENGICVLPATYTSEVPTIVFENGVNNDPSLAWSVTRSRVAVLVSDSERPPEVWERSVNMNSSDETRFIFSFYSENAQWPHISQAFNQSCTALLSLNMTNGQDTLEKNPSDLFCEELDILQQIPHRTKTIMANLVLGVSFVMQVNGLSVSRSECDGNMECLILNDEQFDIDPNTNSLRSRELALHMNLLSNISGQNNQSLVVLGNSSVYLSSVFPLAVRDKDCGSYCSHCSHCAPTEVSDIKMMSSGKGHAYIVGFFPIHLSTDQSYCTESNPIGYASAVAFLEGIKSFGNTSSTDVASGVQGVVFDSCGVQSQINNVIDRLETCSQAFQEQHGQAFTTKSLEPSSIIAYIDGMNDLGHFKLTPKTSKVILSIDKSGYATSNDLDLSRIFIENSATALSKIAWTVLNVIVSNEEPFLSMSTHLRDFITFLEFCLVQEVILHSDFAHRNSSLQKIRFGMDKTPVYFLLTNDVDTREVIQHVKEIADNEQVKASFIFTPWNKHLSDASYVRSSSSVNIIFSSSTTMRSPEERHSMDSLLMATAEYTPWSSEFNSSYSLSEVLTSSRTDLEMVMLATNDLLDALTVDNGLIKWTRPISAVKSTSLDMTSDHVYRGRTFEIAHVDNVVTRRTPFTGPAHDVCKGWCAACNVCPAQELAKQTSLHLPGDLIVTGLFPLHSAGRDAFSCGAVQDDTAQHLLVHAFMFALDTVDSRYPDLLPGLKMGGLVLDTCSNPFMALKVLGDFETCTTNFGKSSPHHQDTVHDNSSESAYPQLPNPTQNVAYLVEGSNDGMNSVLKMLDNSKYEDLVFVNGKPSTSEIAEDNAHLALALVKILNSLNWNKVIILVEQIADLQSMSDAFLLEAYKTNICVVEYLPLDTKEFWRVRNVLNRYSDLPVVLLSMKMSAEMVFFSLKTKAKSFFWIIPVTSGEWREFPSVASYFPTGSIVVDTKSKENEEFTSYLHNSTMNDTLLSSVSDWYRDLWRLRFACYFPSDKYRSFNFYAECPMTSPVSDKRYISPAAHDVIKSVDGILHGVHEQYVTRCPERTGICEDFASYLKNGKLSFLPSVNFRYQGEQLEYNYNRAPISTLSIFNKQRDGVVQVGSYFKSSLTLEVPRIRLYTNNGLELTQIPSAECGPDCTCQHVALSTGHQPGEGDDYMYHTSQGKFIGELWAIIVVALAGSGAFMSVVFAIYVLYKVCRRALGKRYVGLGLSLLLSIMVLYLTVLPFLFTPNEAVCGMKYLLSGLAYAFCFAVIIVKLMSLQSYKVIGLGGEVSGVNQFLTVFFIVGVQVAVGVQWWVHSTPTVFSTVDSFGAVKYACHFQRKEYALYHIYVMFLIVVSCVYAIGVRKEKKNMREARLLLACSWTCLVIWVAWLLCFFLLDRKWSDVIVCAAILACATATMFIVFIPKIRMVSRLKYDLSQKNNFRNGYSVDTDFLYERPYSLPGTLTSTFSSGKMNYPKTFSNFDSDVNY